MYECKYKRVSLWKSYQITQTCTINTTVFTGLIAFTYWWMIYHTEYKGSDYRSIQNIKFPLAKISVKYVLGTSQNSGHHHGSCYSNHCIDGAICCTILTWGNISTQINILLILQKILHKLLVIEESIFIVAYLYYHYLTLSPPLKVTFVKYPTWLEHHLLWDTFIPLWYYSIHVTMNDLFI